MPHTLSPSERDNALIRVHLEFSLLDIHARREYHMRSIAQKVRWIAAELADKCDRPDIFWMHYYGQS